MERVTEPEVNIKAAQTKPEKLQGEKGKTETNKYTRQRFKTNQINHQYKSGGNWGTKFNNNW